MRPIAAVALERELDERAFDGHEVESRRRDDERHGGSALILGPLNGNRCMLVAGSCRTHDDVRGKDDAADARQHNSQFVRKLARFCLRARDGW